ncbi:MAG: pyruvate carboxylase subunit B [Desulfomonile tiedjei]|uniref:Pyruvate carboxylase subunit B n=1 Tax=Desulfomonile tiedjei TaxID=2358 RepID=A0A9D6Z686_9BACT|nr:pyruvate carboxylase subunit B [Desulfomonile tiedjei]
MKPERAKQVKIFDITLRDGSQSKVATRIKLEDLLKVARKLAETGIYGAETWGGATFDVCVRFLREDPWERARMLKAAMPNVKSMMLIRGQNLVAYSNFSDDVVNRFVHAAARNGIDVFRIFDALDDMRNHEAVIRSVKEVGKIAEGAVCYTLSPVHTIEKFVSKARQLEDKGVDQIAIKDMAGLIDPNTTFELVSSLKKAVSLPIHLHTHDNCGLGMMSVLKAVEAGCDMIDSVLSPFAGGTGHPCTESLVYSLHRMGYETGCDLAKLTQAAEDARSVRGLYSEFEAPYSGVDCKMLVTQIPGGVMSNLSSQLRQQNALNRLNEIIDEIPRVREDLGWIPLVTPTSQIVVSQATFNVLLGRYKIIANHTANLLKGLYGETPAPVNKELQKRVLKDEKPVTVRPAELLPPMWPELEKKFPGLTEEEILIHAIFPHEASGYFESKK